MKIRSNAAPSDVYAAANAAGVCLYRFDVRGARTHAHGYNVHLEGSSGRATNSGHFGAGSHPAATWDEWGVFLAHLFAVDPTTDATYYKGRDDFDLQTGERYTPTGLAESHTPCRTHKWEYAAPRSFTCAKGCGAVRVRV